MTRKVQHVWEVDWSHEGNKWPKVWARDLNNHMIHCREWGYVSVYVLRKAGVSTPTFRSDSWEVDWEKRNGKLVWARNEQSKMPDAREWHWVDFHTLEDQGIKWKPVRESNGRGITVSGYVTLHKCGMSNDEIELAEKYGLFLGTSKKFVMEHRLVAAKKYQRSLKGMVVRHLNGIKTDNRPENLVLGTTQENTMDHNTARLMAMYWREKYEELLKKQVNWGLVFCANSVTI